MKLAHIAASAPRDIIQKSGFSDRMPDIRLPMAPPTRVRSLVIWMAVMGVGLFGGIGSWAALAPMTSAVVASGSFRVVGDRLVVQHLEGGIVRAINVREGDLITEGQVLVVLDETRTLAQIAILNSQLASALAQDLRLRAEHLAETDMVVTEELAALLAADPTLQPLLDAQRDIFNSNTEMLIGQVEILRNRILQFDEQLSGIAARRASLQEQLALIQDVRVDLQALQQQGLVTQDRLTDRLQDEAAILGDLGIIESDRLSTLQQIAEIDERILQVRRTRLLDIAAERQEVQASIFDLRQRIAATKEVLNRQTIRAPRAGRIVNLEVNTLGGVIEGGARLLEIVPSDADFVVETKVAPSDIDEVTLGGMARVRLSAYSFSSTPPLEGEVVYVSADSLVDVVTGQPYFRVDVAVSIEALTALPHIRTLPGMPADVMIETGQQTLAEYILNPVMGGMETALTESN